ncbi:hypothetical protein CGCF415_v001700 [Colletotrichum fructicola]|nr:hypothetical protein CGCF415_v001700 [Colletotrichum fructicola]
MHDSRFAPEQSKPPQSLALKALFITTLVALLIAILLMYFIDHLSRREFWVRRRLERFCDSECEHWGNKLPLGRSDAFSFLFHDFLTMSTESKKRLLYILRAAELEKEGFHGGMFPDEWLEFLPWRVVQALHPAVSMSLSDLPANNSGDQGPEVIYGSKAWFQAPHDGRILPKIVHHPDIVTITEGSRNSRRLEKDACLDNVLTALMEPLIRDMRAAHRVTPTEDLTFSWEFMFAIRWAWTDNPYLVDFQTRHEVPIWGVPVPQRLLAAGTDTGTGPRRRVFKPHFGFVGFWAAAFQIAVDSAARAARVELDEGLDMPAPKDLEKVINGFRMLHTALLSNFAGAFDENRDAAFSLEEVVQQAFHDAVTSEYTHEMDREVEEHWRALAKWRPSA